MDKNREDLIDQIAEHLRTAVKMGSPVDPYYTPEMLRAAETILELRRTFLTRSGEPDILGTSYAYRQAFGEAMTRAGLQGHDRTRAGSSMRYHIGNLLRERLSPEEIKELGLVKASPRETSSKAHAHKSRLWNSVNDPETEPITDPKDAVEALLGMSALLGLIRVDWAQASPQQRQIAEMAAKSIADSVQGLAD